MGRRYQRNKYGSIITPSGDTITKKMQADYKRAVDKANYQREKMVNHYYEQVKGTPTMVNISKEVYAKQLQQKGFIPPKMSKSFKDFQSREMFKNEIKDTRVLGRGKYHSDKLINARDKMLEQVSKNYNSFGDPVLEVINKLSDTEFIMMYTSAKKSMLQALYYEPDALEDKRDELLSDMQLSIQNITPKENRENRMLELGFWHRNENGKIVKERKVD